MIDFNSSFPDDAKEFKAEMKKKPKKRKSEKAPKEEKAEKKPKKTEVRVVVVVDNHSSNDNAKEIKSEDKAKKSDIKTEDKAKKAAETPKQKYLRLCQYVLNVIIILILLQRRKD
jgi:hypothetical protein